MSKKDKISLLDYLKKFWDYVWHGDSFGSYVANIIVAFLIIKFLLFPGLGLVLNNDFPVVAVVSGSMEHKIVDNRVCDKTFIDTSSKNLDTQEWWNICGDYYKENFNMTLDQFETFDYSNGLNIGDVMILYGKDPQDIEIGEILVFVPGDQQWYANYGPVIHRVVDKWEDDKGEWHFTTKGDHNPEVITRNNFEKDITEDQVIAVGVFKVPWLGYGKILLNNLLLSILSIF